jgi:thymidylate synthase
MNRLDVDYQELLKDILDNGIIKNDRTGTGTKSVFGRQIRHKMSDGFPLLTTKKMAWKQIIVELLWFLRGDTNIKFLIDNGCHIWDGDCYKNYCKTAGNLEEPNYDVHIDDPNENCTRLMTKDEFIDRIKTDDRFAKRWGKLGPIYGAQWRRWDGIDQIANLINDLKTNPDSRRLMVSAWNVNYLEDMVLPPCHYGFQVYTRELSDKERIEWMGGKIQEKYPALVEQQIKHCDEHNVPKRAISLMWNQRSVDTPLGLPFNIASYGLLLVFLGKIVNMVPDELIGNLGDCHIYLNQIEGIKEQLTREPFELPQINISTEWWPTESGECGIGPIDSLAVLSGFSDDNFCKCLLEGDIQLFNYLSHRAIKMPLSN